MERQTSGREDEVDSHSDPEEEIVIEKWHEVVETITKTTKDAYAVAPRFDPSSPSTFETHWHAVFSQARDSVSADPKIPRHLTTPPATKFTVTLFDAMHGLCCPCGHPPVEPNIVLENKDGVTKDDFMRTFVEYMYGGAFPRVYREPDPVCSKEYGETEAAAAEPAEDPEEGFRDDEGVLVYSAGWMSAGDSGLEKVAYGDEPNIVLYCCGHDEFAKRREQADRQEAGAGASAREAKL